MLLSCHVRVSEWIYTFYFCWMTRNSLLEAGASSAIWLGVRSRNKWLWVQIPLLSLKLKIWRLLRARSSLTFGQTIECKFTLKLVRDMIITYSQIHRTDKYSQHSSIIWTVWLNGWVFFYKLSVCGFESRCCQITCI